MAQFTDLEQYMLELINRARLDPVAEASRYGLSDLNRGVANGITGDPLAPLAGSTTLRSAAVAHSNWMLVNNLFQHDETSGSSGFTAVHSYERMAAYGYGTVGTFSSGENISWRGTTGTLDVFSAVADAHAGLFLSDGHRSNILSSYFTEIGIGQLTGLFRNSGHTFNSSMVTQDYGSRSSQQNFITGVVYDDTVLADDFYTPGEGLAGVTVTVTGSTATQTSSSGGYEVANVALGTATVTFSGGGLAQSVTATVDTPGGNVKVDLVDRTTIQSSQSATLGLGAVNLVLLGGAVSGTGNSANNQLTGTRFDNVLSGLGGADVLSGLGGDDSLSGGDGNDTLAGGDGNDTLDGGAGSDLLFGGAGIDQLIGGDGNDNLYVVGNDSLLEGGNGYDQVIVLDTAGVNIQIGSGVEYVAGNSGADVLNANALTTGLTIGGAGGNDSITGGSGNDVLAGNDGNDTVMGGDGDDIVFGGAGVDDLYGGDGDDKLYILGNDGFLEGGTGYDRVIVLDTAGVSIQIGNGVEYAAGNAGGDVINASNLMTAIEMGGAGGNDTLTGGSGNDTVGGGIGADLIFGGAGADLLLGGDGNDTLNGGTGNDSFLGGNGFDTFVFEAGSGNDYVFQFQNGQDVFDFTGHTQVNAITDVTITDNGADAYIALAGGGQIIVFGAAGLIEQSDFLF